METLFPYIHPDCALIQSQGLAQTVANTISALYPEGTKINYCKWKGNGNFDINQTFTLIDRFGEESTCKCTFVKNVVDSNYRQEIKAKKLC